MFDEVETLRENPDLQRLLDHYVGACAADRDAWQDRLMALAGVEARELVRLHGLLIGFGWLEQNTGHTPVVRPGAVPGCYRATAAGLRALRLCPSARGEEDADALAAGGAGTQAAPGDGSEVPAPKGRERRKAKTATEMVQTSVIPVPAEEPGEAVVASAGQREEARRGRRPREPE
jgi:hypothetical protein